MFRVRTLIALWLARKAEVHARSRRRPVRKDSPTPVELA
jgi:hypothetical protein